MPYQHLLLTVDFTKGNQKVIKAALELAKIYNAKLSLLHVVEPLPANSYGFVDVIDIETQLIEQVREELAKLAAEYHIAPENQYIEVGPAKKKILEFTAEHHCDAIVIGSHGRHGISALLGSTANSVAHHAECDVLMVRIED